MIRILTAYLEKQERQRRQAAACDKLQAMVEATRQSYACESYRRHRDAAKKGLGR